MISFCYTAAGIAEVEHDLHASSDSISLSLSIFILLQGAMPLIWSAVSEIIGRKVRLRERDSEPTQGEVPDCDV